MKKVYMVHCWDGKSEDGWYPWLDKNLSSEEIEVIKFDMPNTSSPTIDDWVSTLDKYVEVLDENTFFVGHSIGCQTIMRYLERKEETNIGGIFFVAPWLNLLPAAIEDQDSLAIATPWINTPIDFNKIKKFTKNINCLFSYDDYFVDINQEKEFKEKLGANTLLVTGCGHISQDDGIYELDEILILAKKMLGINHE